MSSPDRLGQGALSEEPSAQRQAWEEYADAQEQLLEQRARQRLTEVEAHLSRAVGETRAENLLADVRQYIKVTSGRAA